jgi:hypothetical protein
MSVTRSKEWESRLHCPILYGKSTGRVNRCTTTRTVDRNTRSRAIKSLTRSGGHLDILGVPTYTGFVTGHD